MTLLKQPSEIHDNVVVKGLIYGQPGTGKTTLALSAPNPVMIDADKGMYRVEKRFQVPSLPLTSYANVLELMQGDELKPFDTVVFDTLGELVDRIGDYVCEKNPKYRQGDGQLSVKAWGGIKLEFQNLLRMAASANKHLIFVAHEKEDRDGDTRFVRPDVSGSSGKDIVKKLDFMGYVEMRGNQRTISFSPSEKIYAKNSLKLPAFIPIPDTDSHPNDFIQKQIISRTIDRLQEDEAVSETYNALIEKVGARVDQVENAEQADAMLKEITSATVIWDSVHVLKHRLSSRVKAIGVTYDKEAGRFVNATKDEAPAQAQPQPEAPAEPVQETLPDMPPAYLDDQPQAAGGAV